MEPLSMGAWKGLTRGCGGEIVESGPDALRIGAAERAAVPRPTARWNGIVDAGEPVGDGAGVEAPVETRYNGVRGASTSGFTAPLGASLWAGASGSSLSLSDTGCRRACVRAYWAAAMPAMRATTADTLATKPVKGLTLLLSPLEFCGPLAASPSALPPARTAPVADGAVVEPW